MNKVIDCKAIAQKILDEVKAVPEKKKLVVISFGENKEAESYLRGLRKDCKYCGIELVEVNTLGEMYEYTQPYYSNGGYIALEPIPEEMYDYIIPEIFGDRDIDGLTGGVPPCIAEAVLEILKTQYDDLTGKNALVVGRGRVGKAVAEMLLKADCTVTIAHSKTDDVDLTVFIQDSDIIVSAAGKPIIDGDDCWCSTIIDCGTSADENGKIKGDISNAECADDCTYTPVPNGVGLVTRAVLLRRLANN